MTGSLRKMAVLGFVATLITAGGVASAGDPGPVIGPTTAPDLDEQNWADVAAIARRLNARRWGPPIIQTFDKPEAKTDWTSPAGTVDVAGGRLVIEPEGGGAGGFCMAQRPLPEALRGAEGLRVEVRLDSTRAGMIHNLGLIVSRQDAQVNQWDCHYQFAAGGRGRIQRFRSATVPMGPSEAIGDFAPDAPADICLEIIGPVLTGQRGDHPAMRFQGGSVPLNADTVVGFTGHCRRLRIERLTLRALQPTARLEELAAMWKETRFAGPTELTACLSRDVVPRLGAAAFAERKAAEDRLRMLLPLSRPALEAALKDAASSDAQARLQIEALLQFRPPMFLGEPQPETPPATQPHAPAQTGGDT